MYRHLELTQKNILFERHVKQLLKHARKVGLRYRHRCAASSVVVSQALCSSISYTNCRTLLTKSLPGAWGTSHHRGPWRTRTPSAERCFSKIPPGYPLSFPDSRPSQTVPSTARRSRDPDTEPGCDPLSGKWLTASGLRKSNSNWNR